jgi:hypothetical protein
MPNDKRKSKVKTTIPDKPTKFANQLHLQNQFHETKLIYWLENYLVWQMNMKN